MEHRVLSLHAGYDAPSGFVDAYAARPADGVPRPGLVVISGMGGLNQFQRDMTRTFARAGFAAVSPDLFDGVLPQGRTRQLFFKNALDVDRAVENIAAGADFLRALPWTPSPDAPVGVVGFCLGGGLALLALARSDAFGAGVVLLPQPLPRRGGIGADPRPDAMPLRNRRPHHAALGGRGVPLDA